MVIRLTRRLAWTYQPYDVPVNVTDEGNDVDGSTDGDWTNDSVDSTIYDDRTSDGDWGLVTRTKTTEGLVDGN
jgi:hypothetical protein